jgi:predicted phosphate transport protein (TIGR00153 family)
MRFIPKEEKFFDLFEELAAKIEEGVKFFLAMVEKYEYSDENITRLKQIEHEADSITHKTYEKMHKTFLTPLDREDIYALVNKMDSVIDMIEASAMRLNLYKVKRPSEAIISLAHILDKAVQKIKVIVHGMRDMKNAQMILDACVEVNTLENDGDVVLRMTIAELFEKETDVFELIKWKEIYERLEEAIDVCEDVSNIAEGIVLKNG